VSEASSVLVLVAGIAALAPTMTAIATHLLASRQQRATHALVNGQLEALRDENEALRAVLTAVMGDYQELTERWADLAVPRHRGVDVPPTVPPVSSD
jgi:hypothetical protein